MAESLSVEDSWDDHDWTVAQVSVLPHCDFCDNVAGFDVEMRGHDGGGWAFVCGECFADHASPRVMMFGLGLGRGQRLVCE